MRVNSAQNSRTKKALDTLPGGPHFQKHRTEALRPHTQNHRAARKGRKWRIRVKFVGFHPHTSEKIQNSGNFDNRALRCYDRNTAVSRVCGGEEYEKMRHADRVLLCTHGKFGEELKRSAEMIAGTLDRVKVFSLFPGMTPEELSDKIRTELDSCAAGICLVDIAGGTPFNVTARLAAEYPVAVITGVNLPMLIEVHDGMDEMEYDELARFAVEALSSSGRVIYRKGAAAHE